MNKRIVQQSRLIVFLIGLLLVPAGAALAQYSGGDGNEANPWQIANKADLLALRADTAHYDKHFIMTADVNMAGEVYTTALIALDTIKGFGFQGQAFSGVFDGNGFKITGMTIDGGVNNYYLGLFGKIYGGKIRNLGLENCYVNGDERVGGLVGWNYAGNISNSYATGEIIGWGHVGGLVGWNYSSNISNCYSSGNVSGSYDIGGLVGYTNGAGVIAECNANSEIYGEWYNGGLIGENEDCNVTGCYSTGMVSEFGNNVGGLIGWNKGNIFDCYSISSVTGCYGVGGLTGLNWGNISRCYSSGNVAGIEWVGGLVGYDDQYSGIENCYSAGSVSGSSDTGGLVGGADYLSSISNSYSTGDVNGIGDHIGGLLGKNYESSKIENCFWDTETQSHGLYESVGYNEGGTIINVAGLNTSQMQKKSTYTTLPADWDFVNVWDIGENQTYPYLRQYLAGDLDQDEKVDYRDLAILAENWLNGI